MPLFSGFGIEVSKCKRKAEMEGLKDTGRTAAFGVCSGHGRLTHKPLFALQTDLELSLCSGPQRKPMEEPLLGTGSPPSTGDPRGHPEPQEGQAHEPHPSSMGPWLPGMLLT